MRELLAKSQSGSPSVQSIQESSRLGRQLTQLLQQEETYWPQRAKELWLKLGDQNSKFFHRAATIKHLRK